MPSHSDKVKRLYMAGDLVGLAKILPHLQRSDDRLVQFLLQSNLLEMGKHLEAPVLTLGADPEFILCEKDKPENIILFSSKFTGNDYFGVSAAEIGADYGLLEFRPRPGKTPAELVRNIVDLYEIFQEDNPEIEILEKEEY